MNSKPNVGTVFSVQICASSLIKEEPRFLRRYNIQFKESDKEQLSIKRPGGFVRLSSESLKHFSIPEVPNDAQNDIYDSDYVEEALMENPKILLVNDEPF